MPTLIDSLVVSLGLDPAKFNQGQKDALAAFKKTEAEATKTAKEMEARGTQAAQFFGKVKAQALSLAAVLLGGLGLTAFTKNVTASDQAVGRLAKNLDISTKELSAWEGVAKRFGSSAEDIDAAFRATQQLVQSIKHGEVPADQVNWLSRAGVDMSRFLDDTVAVDAKLKMVQKAFASRPAGEAVFFGGKTGYSENTVNMLRETASSIDALLATQKQLNVATEEDARIARERTKAWLDLEDTFYGTARILLTDLTPAIKAVLEALTALVAYARQNIPLTEAVIGTLTAAFVALSAVRFVGLIAGLAGVTTGIAAATTAAGVFSSVVAGGAIGAALGWIANKGIDWATNGQGLGSLLYDKTDQSGTNATAPTNMSSGRGRVIRPGSEQGNSTELFARLEKQYGLPAGLLDSVWAQESGRGRAMLSPKGAKGHMGFMDPTAAQYGLKDPNNLEESADASARMYRDLLRESNGNLPEALARYNWGSGNVNKFGTTRAPLETQRYMREVPARMSSGGNNSTASVSIQNVTINTKATDADGIARDFTASLQPYVFGLQANRGLE